MTVLMRAEVPGITAEQFEVIFAPVIDQLKVFPGFLANASGPVAGGYQVTEVWESQEAHERWVREVIAPTMQRAGLTEPPSIQYLETVKDLMLTGGRMRACQTLVLPTPRM